MQGNKEGCAEGDCPVLDNIGRRLPTNLQLKPQALGPSLSQIFIEIQSFILYTLVDAKDCVE